MPSRKVVVTGAAGYIAAQLLPAFAKRYELVLLDVTRRGLDKNLGEIHTGDLTKRSLSRLRPHIAGADAIVHCASLWDRATPTTAPLHWIDHRPPNHVDTYYTERGNIDMVFNVMKLAMEEGVRRVVVCSSNHAGDWYETELHSGKRGMVGPDDYPLSDNFYGWAKAAYEGLGFAFATGRFGSPVENVHIRIGAPRPILGEKLAGNPTTYRRDLGAYISPRDLQQLFVKSIEKKDIRRSDGVPFQVFYGISNNTRAFWDISNARQVIGYAPKDDSERVFAADIAKYLTAPGRTR